MTSNRPMAYWLKFVYFYISHTDIHSAGRKKIIDTLHVTSENLEVEYRKSGESARYMRFSEYTCCFLTVVYFNRKLTEICDGAEMKT
jgi:hypothetical protein